MAIPGSTETVRQMAQDGADISSPATMPTGGWGVRGWLSAIFTSFKDAIDVTTGAVKSITYEHHEIHSGSHFFTGNYTTLGNGAVYDIIFVTPDSLKYSHMIFELTTEAEAMFNYYEGITTSSDGTLLTGFDRNRITDNTSGTLFYHTPTITDLGDELGAGIFGSGKSQGGGLRDSNEIVLAPNTKYLIRVTNNTVSSNWYDWQFDWYEHTNKTS